MALQKKQNRAYAGSGVKPLRAIYTRQIRMATPGPSRGYTGSKLPSRGLPQR